ncbi:MAG: DUF2065 domain-containing protein [bacterium]|nr:DUF2065 domain-containing protein [bacterium]
MELFLSALGLAMIIEGLPYFIAPNKLKALARRLPELPGSVIRTFGFTIVLMGLLTIYLGRRYF